MIELEEILAKPTIYLRKNLIKFELILILIVASGFCLKEFNIGAGSIIATFCLILFSMIYFFMAFRPVENKNKYDDFYLKTIGFSLSVAVIGIIYTLQKWPGASIILNLAIISLALAIVFSLAERMFIKKGSSVEKQDLIRLVVVLGIIIIIIFSPLNTKSTFPGEKEEFEKENLQRQTNPEALP